MHHDPAIFPESQSFIPERWLDNPKTSNGSALDRYFVSFGKDDGLVSELSKYFTEEMGTPAD